MEGRTFENRNVLGMRKDGEESGSEGVDLVGMNIHTLSVLSPLPVVDPHASNSGDVFTAE